MTKQVVDLGTGANANNGDPLRTAFTKINSNFTELYVLIGAGTGNITDVTAPAFNHNRHNNVTVTVDSATDQIILDAQLSSVIKDITGSVFADDSTLLVDGVSGKIVGPVEANVTGNVTGDLTGNVTGNVTGDLTGNSSGDHYGSVYGDDSTRIIDSTESSINLDGTVKGNIIPDQNIAYDIGSSTNRFKDLWLSGTTINLGNSALSATPSGGISLPAGTSIPGVTISLEKPGSIQDDRATVGVPNYNINATVVAGSTIIDSATWEWSHPSIRTPDFIPSVYDAVIDGSGNVTSITINTANYYTDITQDYLTINTDNMYAIDPGIDITDPAAIRASSQVEILAASIRTIADSAPVQSGVTLLSLPGVVGDGTAGQVLTTDGAGTFTFTTVSGGSSSGPTVHAYHSSDQTVYSLANNSNQATKLQLDSTLWDTDSSWDTVNSQFQPTTAGYYNVTVNIQNGSNTSVGNIRVMIAKNGFGNFNPYGYVAGVDGLLVNGSMLVPMNGTTDYLEFYSYADSNYNTYTGNGGRTFVQATWVREL